jgi:phosphate:Na+ symporter
LPFLPLFVRLLNRIVPPKDYKEKSKLTDLDIRMLETPLLAIEQSRNEIAKMSVGCVKMLDWVEQLREQDEPDKQLGDKLIHREQILDSMQDEIAVFVTDLLANDVPHTVAGEGRRQLRMADEYESISDYVVNLQKFDRRLRRDGHRFSQTQREGLKELNKLATEYLEGINECLRQDKPSSITKTDAVSKRLRIEIKQLRRQHLEDLSGGDIPPLVSVAYLATLNAYSRVRDHTENIAEAFGGDK